MAKRTRRARVSGSRRWLAVGGSCSSRSSTTGRSGVRRRAHELAQRRRPRCSACSRERARSSSAARASSSARALAREARRLGFVRPGERLFIVKGITALAQAQRTRLRSPHGRWTTIARSSRGRSAARRARSAASRSAARSAARPSPSRRLRRRRRAVPDDLLRSRAATSSPPSRGSRPRAASSAGAALRGRTRSCARASSGDAEQRELRRASRPRAGATRASRGLGGARRRGCSSACTPTWPSRSRDPGTSSASGSSPRSSRSGRPTAAVPPSRRLASPAMPTVLDHAREWQEGHRRLQAARPTAAATPACFSRPTS